MKNYSFRVRNEPLRNSLGGLTVWLVPEPKTGSGHSTVKDVTI